MEQLCMEHDGFHGYYHIPKKALDEKKAVIVLGGSEGNEKIPVQVGELFCNNGICALGVNYWNMPGLPQELVHIPVECIEAAVNWLQDKGFSKITVYGISKGAELALLAASLIPGISAVIALSPSFCVWAGLSGGSSMLKKGMSETKSSFTWRRKPLPFVKGKKRIGGILWRLLTERQLNMRFQYEDALKNLTEDAVIKVENINGPVLLISPGQDSIWPSEYSGEQIVKRLAANHFPHPFQHMVYPDCSHVITPVRPQAACAFKIERTETDKCQESRKDAFDKSLAFIKSL